MLPRCRAAHAAEDDATDDAALVEAIGGRVVSVAGEPGNIKVTNPLDVSWRGRAGRGRLDVAGCRPWPPCPRLHPRRPPVSVRVGQGFDIHPFSDDPARPLMLGGLRIEGRGLSGHSDADVVCHSIADALLGAAGLGDIGTLFPDTDPP